MWFVIYFTHQLLINKPLHLIQMILYRDSYCFMLLFTGCCSASDGILDGIGFTYLPIIYFKFLNKIQRNQELHIHSLWRLFVQSNRSSILINLLAQRRRYGGLTKPLGSKLLRTFLQHITIQRLQVLYTHKNSIQMHVTPASYSK